MAVYEYTVSLKDQVSASAAHASVQVNTLTRSLAGLRNQLARQQATGDLAGMQNSVNKIGAVQNRLQQLHSEKPAIDGIGDSLAGLAGPAAIAATAIAAVTAAVGGLLLEGAKMALGAADFKRQSEAAFKDLTGSAAGARQVMSTLRDLQNEVPQTEAQIAEQAKALLAEGLNPAQLRSGIKAMAAVAAVEGQRGADAVKNIMTTSLAKGHFTVSAKQLKTAGLTEAELANALGMSPRDFENAVKHGTIGAEKGISAMNNLLSKKYKGSLAAALDDPKVMLAKFKDAIFDLFKDVNTGPFLQGIRDIGKAFGADTPAGKVLKATVTGLFNGLFALATKALPYVKHALLEVVIVGLKLYIAAKPLIAQVKELGNQLGLTSQDGYGLVNVFATLATIWGRGVIMSMRIAVAAIQSAVTAWQVLSGAVSKAWTAVTAATGAAIAWLKGAMDGGAIAGPFIEGLAGGIKAGVAFVVAAVKHLGSSVVAAIKAILGISSPSKVMHQMGRFTAQGFGGGMRAENDNAHAAAADMAQAATGGAAVSTSTSSSKSIHVHFAEGAIQINGAGKDAEEITEAAVTLVFERIALMQAAG